MVIDINEYKSKKTSQMIYEVCNSAKEGGYVVAEACYALAYKMKEIESQMKVNQMIVDKLKRK
jgi:hypothetical protein